MYLNTNRQDIQGDKMDYRDGFEDGVKFTREVIIDNIRAWANECADSNDAQVMDDIADKIEFGTLDNDI
jgi:hypothetical protein